MLLFHKKERERERIIWYIINYCVELEDFIILYICIFYLCIFMYFLLFCVFCKKYELHMNDLEINLEIKIQVNCSFVEYFYIYVIDNI